MRVRTDYHTEDLRWLEGKVVRIYHIMQMKRSSVTVADARGREFTTAPLDCFYVLRECSGLRKFLCKWVQKRSECGEIGKFNRLKTFILSMAYGFKSRRLHQIYGTKNPSALGCTGSSSVARTKGLLSAAQPPASAITSHGHDPSERLYLSKNVRISAMVKYAR